MVGSHSTEGWDVHSSKTRNRKIVILPRGDRDLGLVSYQFHAFILLVSNSIFQFCKLLLHCLVALAVHLETRPIYKHTRATLHVGHYHTLGLSVETAVVVKTLTVISKEMYYLGMVGNHRFEMTVLNIGTSKFRLNRSDIQAKLIEAEKRHIVNAQTIGVNGTYSKLLRFCYNRIEGNFHISVGDNILYGCNFPLLIACCKKE